MGFYKITKLFITIFLFLPVSIQLPGHLLNLPLVVLPSAIKWNTLNKVIVTPTDWSNTNMNVTFTVLIKKSPNSLDEELFKESRSVNAVGQAQTFVFNTSHKPSVDEYEVRVHIPRHNLYAQILHGVPNTKFVSIQTDKGYYKPGEKINIRILPVTDEGEVFTGPMKVSLINPQGFKVHSDTVQAFNHFIRHSFTVPDYSKTGTWLITASPINSSLTWMTAQTQIRIEQYSLPKFFVSMIVKDSESDSNKGFIHLNAKYPHGEDVQGDVLIYCNENTTIPGGKLNNGEFKQEFLIKHCLTNGINDYIKIKAIVTSIIDREIVTSITEYKHNNPLFQIIPLRPFYDLSTTSINLYFKSLSSSTTNKFNITGKYHCVGGHYNGLNMSFMTKPDTTYEFRVDNTCKLYIIQASRNIYGKSSEQVVLFIPQIYKVESLHLSLINSPKKAVYHVNEKFETTVSSMMNYVVICNKNDIVDSGSVSTNGFLSFEITREMQGYCYLIVYGNNQLGNRNIHSDMWIFFVKKSNCPSTFSLTTDKTQLIPPNNLTLTVKGVPGSLGVIRAIDERLNHILDYLTAPKPVLYWDLNIFTSTTRELNAPKLINFIEAPKVFGKIKTTCREASKKAAINPIKDTTKLKEITDVSDFCIKEFVNAFEESSEEKTTSLDMQQQSVLHTASIYTIKAKENNIEQMNYPLSEPTKMNDDIKMGSIVELEYDDEIFLRTFFPEIWYFDDIKINSRNGLKLNLASPHSISKWSISSIFWEPKTTTTCSTSTVNIETKRHVFMEVDLPKHVYENETIKAKIIVNGNNFEDETQLSVCFTGLSPVVCADMGRNGEMAETEYTRVTLSSKRKRTEKIVYLKFLKQGYQNVSFELRKEVNVVGHQLNHCADPDAKIYDQILTTVKVRKRLDQREHFRQINIYPQRKRIPKAISDINVIRFNQDTISNDEVLTNVTIDADVNVISTFLEFSEFQPSFPLGVVSNEIQSSRSRRSVSFSFIVMNYAFATYDKKQSRLNGLLKDGSLRQENIQSKLLTMRSELFRYSNCSSDMKMCAFGESGPPGGDVQPSLLYTATVTSLMCEDDVEDFSVCGPLYYLNNVSMYGVENIDIDFHGQIKFSTKEEEIFFIVAVLKQTFNDCMLRSCYDSEAARKLIETIYKFNERKNFDIRVEAALAGATNLVAAKLRQKILSKANVDTLPYWKVDKKYSMDDMMINENITANSLALLAFVNQSTQIYDYYRAHLNLPRLAEWLIEEQTSNQHYQTAIDTFYAWRALYRYNERVTGPKNINNIEIELINDILPIRKYTNNDLPFTIQIPSNITNLTIKTIGDGKIIAGIRVISSPRKRLKRDDNLIPNILITCKQTKVDLKDNYITQIICIKTKSKYLKKLEIDHNIYTGFTTNFNKFQIINGTGKLYGLEQIIETGLHFTLINLTPNYPTCYQLILKEPTTPYTASFLAPVTIDAYYNNVKGQLILHASDIKVLIKNNNMYKRRNHPLHLFRKQKRDNNNDDYNVDNDSASSNLVDTVCLEHGTCTCAELSCSATCMRCSHTQNWRELKKSIENEIKDKNKFGILAEYISETKISTNNDEYNRIEMQVVTKNQRRKIFGCNVPFMDKFILWIRSCNGKCLRLKKDGTYLIVGHINGFFKDTSTIVNNVSNNSTQILMQNYLLRDGDTIEGADLVNDDESTCSEMIQKFHFFHYQCDKK